MAVKFEDRLPQDEALTKLRNQFVDATLCHVSSDLHRYTIQLIRLLADNKEDLSTLVEAFGLDPARLPDKFEDTHYMIDESMVVEDLHALMLEFVVDRLGFVFDHVDWCHAPEGHVWQKGSWPKAMSVMDVELDRVQDKDKSLDPVVDNYPE